MDCHIREANSNDLDEIFVLLAQFATSFTPDRKSFERCVDHLIRDDSAWLAVAEYDGEIVGYCLGFDHYALYANGRVSWVEEITVKEESRRKGIGRALMTAFEAWAQSRDSRLVALATRRAAPFYAALGYEESAVYFKKMVPTQAYA
jgi:GNAT superfamily N-acetyltransferase